MNQNTLHIPTELYTRIDERRRRDFTTDNNIVLCTHEENIHFITATWKI